MQSKLGLMTLGVITPLVLLNGTPVQAKTSSTDKKPATVQAKPAERRIFPLDGAATAMITFSGWVSTLSIRDVI